MVKIGEMCTVQYEENSSTTVFEISIEYLSSVLGVEF